VDLKLTVTGWKPIDNHGVDLLFPSKFFRVRYAERMIRTFPVEPSTLNCSRSSSPSRDLATMKNLGNNTYIWDYKKSATCLWDMTRSTRSQMFFGHLFLKIAPRFSDPDASEVASFSCFVGTFSMPGNSSSSTCFLFLGGMTVAASRKTIYLSPGRAT
jgi:hypothetical protein